MPQPDQTPEETKEEVLLRHSLEIKELRERQRDELIAVDPVLAERETIRAVRMAERAERKAQRREEQEARKQEREARRAERQNSQSEEGEAQ